MSQIIRGVQQLFSAGGAILLFFEGLGRADSVIFSMSVPSLVQSGLLIGAAAAIGSTIYELSELRERAAFLEQELIRLQSSKGN